MEQEGAGSQQPPEGMPPGLASLPKTPPSAGVQAFYTRAFGGHLRSKPRHSTPGPRRPRLSHSENVFSPSPRVPLVSPAPALLKSQVQSLLLDQGK